MKRLFALTESVWRCAMRTRLHAGFRLCREQLPMSDPASTDDRIRVIKVLENLASS